MMDFIMVPCVVGIVFAGVYFIFSLFVRRRERIMLIEKLGDKLTSADIGCKINLPAFNMPGISFNALKTGCLLMGIGLGVMVGFVLNVVLESNSSNWNLLNVYQLQSAAYGASVLFFGGTGLIIAFIVEMVMKRKKKIED